MRNAQCRPPFHELLQGSLHRPFRLGVQRTRGLVQHKYRSIFIKSLPGQSPGPLALTSGKQNACSPITVANRRLLHDEHRRRANAGPPPTISGWVAPDALVRCSKNRLIDNTVILVTTRDLVAQILACHLADIHIPGSDSASLRIIKAQQEVRDAWFCPTLPPTKATNWPGLIERLRSLITTFFSVGEPDVFQVNGAPAALSGLGSAGSTMSFRIANTRTRSLAARAAPRSCRGGDILSTDGNREMPKSQAENQRIAGPFPLRPRLSNTATHNRTTIPPEVREFPKTG